MHRLDRVTSEALPSSPDDSRIGPFPYGTVVDTRLNPSQDGLWEQLPSGDWLWRLHLQSDDAVSLSVAFTRFQLPEGAAVYLYGPNNEEIRGPYTADDATASQHWTPLVHGDELTIEVRAPRTQRSAVQLEIGRVVHGVRSILPTAERDGLSKSGSCNLDVACSEADPWRKQVRSVGLYSYEEGGVAFACTGSLVNNTAEDKTPYFLTAEHCISSPEVASTMVFYWNYQNATCRTPGTPENGQVTDDPPGDQTSSGAVLRARYGNSHDENNIAGKPDLALVEVDDDIPDRYDLYFSGWSRAGGETSRGVTIHHPSAHGKRISFDDDPTTITAYGEPGGGDTHLRIGNWELGTTEGGSSGAPLFDADQHIVGVLSGGFAGCGGDGDADDNNRPDWYGRIAPGFENGDYQNATLADWLDPQNTGTMTLDGRPQSDADDQTPPATIEDLRVDSIGVTSMTLQWTAPGDDGNLGAASSYDLRFSTTPITSEADFSSAIPAQDEPVPDTAGTVEHGTVGGLTPDSTYYFAIKAIDDGGNASPLGTTPSGTPLPDQVPPAAISDLQVTNINTAAPAVTLSWTATGDDGNEGTASEYTLWFAPSPFEAPADTQNAQRLTDPNPAPAGQQEAITVDGSDGLQQDQTYYFALVAEDNAGNRSPLSTANRKAVLVRNIDIEPGGMTAGAAGGVSETRFVLNETQDIRVTLYDMLGRRIRVVFDQRVREGFERVVRVQTHSLSSGAYFLHFVGDQFTTTRKIVLVQ